MFLILCHSYSATRYLQNSQEEIQVKVEALCTSLNICKLFPELHGNSFKFIWMLLQAIHLHSAKSVSVQQVSEADFVVLYYEVKNK